MKFAAFVFKALPATFMLLSLLSGAAHAAGGDSPYMTVEEYNRLHPRQIALEAVFTAIVQDPPRPIETGMQKKPVRIAFIYPGMQASDYWQRSLDSFKKRMDELRIEYVVDEYFSKPVVDTRVQQEQMKKALENDPDYLVFTLDAVQHRMLIERLITRGRPKIILQNITTPLRAWENRQPFLYVGFDHATGARILANYFMTHFTNGKYGILYFGRGYVTEMRGLTFLNDLREAEGLDFAGAYYTDGIRKKAELNAMEILRDPEVRFIYACSTSVALGALDAVRKLGLQGKVAVNGWGGGSNELEAVLSGEMEVTVMRMNDDNGVAMAEAVKLDLEGKGKMVPTVYSGEFALVKKGVDRNELDKLTRRAFRYSGR